MPLGRRRRSSDFSRGRVQPGGQDPHTATYDRIQNALLIGDFGRARRAAEEYLATVPAENRGKAERSLKLGVQQREPIKVGPYHSAEVKQAFLEWAGKNLSEPQVEEIERVQRTYEGVRAMAGW